MVKPNLDLLKNLMLISSPSGFEGKLADYIVKYFKNKKRKNYIVEKDFQNNVIVTIPGSGKGTIMLDAHLDEIGFIVTNIDRDGLISLQYIGGGDSSILSARELLILTEKGIVNAVVNRKHAHLVTDEEDENIIDIKDAQIDVGIRGRKAVSKIVKIGDPVIYKPTLFPLLGSALSGYGFDDKAGCYILMRTIEELKKMKRKSIPTLIFTFSAQEETYGSKAHPLVMKYNPDLFIEVDVTFATDYGTNDEMEREVGRCKLGQGIVLYRGVDIYKEGLKIVEGVARRNKMKIQYQASTGMTGYTATEVSKLLGARAMILGIPLRNMHTPVEIIDIKDLESGIKLLSYFLVSTKLVKALGKISI